MTTFPPLTHVALTVRDLSVSVPWYEALFGASPVLLMATGLSGSSASSSVLPARASGSVAAVYSVT